MKGRKRLPANVRELRGTGDPKSDRDKGAPARELEAFAKAPRPPSHIERDKIAAAFWRKKAKDLVQRGVLTPAHLVQLEVYAMAYANYRATPSTYWANTLIRIGTEFGDTPASSTKAHQPKRPTRGKPGAGRRVRDGAA